MKSKSNPSFRKPVVDRLVFILPWACGPVDDQVALIKPIRRRIVKEIEADTAMRAYPKGARYRENFRIPLTDTKVLVQIGALQPKRQRGGIRVEMTPSKFVPGDVDHFHAVMRRIVGRGYAELLMTPFLNHFDAAVDAEGLALDRVLVRYRKAHQFTMFGKRVGSGARIETINFGSKSSDYVTAVYDKRTQLVDAALKRLVKTARQHATAEDDPLTDTAIKKVKAVLGQPELMRIEVRGKKLRGLPLYKLSSQPNRFERLEFADLNAAGKKLPLLIERSFIAMCRQYGVTAALAAFKGSEHARKVHAFWRERQADWWQPAKFWKQACDALRKTGIFPDQAFEPHSPTGIDIDDLMAKPSAKARRRR